MRISFYPFLLLVSSVALGQSESVFIPQSPANPEQIEELKELMRSTGWAEESISDFFAEGAVVSSFPEQNFRAAYPELIEEDVFLSLCSNSIMGGAGAVTFVGPPEENRVRVKSTSCSAAEGGKFCGPMREETRYFFESSEHLTDLQNGVSVGEAYNLLGLYRDDLIVGLPDWISENFTYLDVTEISRTSDGFSSC
jgi:hypothetical protein